MPKKKKKEGWEGVEGNFPPLLLYFLMWIISSCSWKKLVYIYLNKLRNTSQKKRKNLANDFRVKSIFGYLEKSFQKVSEGCVCKLVQFSFEKVFLERLNDIPSLSQMLPLSDYISMQEIKCKAILFAKTLCMQWAMEKWLD